MATTQQVLEAATHLGKLIAEHEAAKKLEATGERLKQDTEAQRLLSDYNRHMKAIREKEADGKPIEVEDKRQLEKYQQDVTQNNLLRDLQMVQMDYLDLMRRVEEAMHPAPVQQASAPPAAGMGESPIQNP